MSNKDSIYFLYGYQGESWGERHRSGYFTCAGILPINPIDTKETIYQIILNELVEGIQEKRLDKKRTGGGSGDLGGSNFEFTGRFFSQTKDKDLLALISELQKDLEEVVLKPIFNKQK